MNRVSRRLFSSPLAVSMTRKISRTTFWPSADSALSGCGAKLKSPLTSKAAARRTEPAPERLQLPLQQLGDRRAAVGVGQAGRGDLADGDRLVLDDLEHLHGGAADHVPEVPRFLGLRRAGAWDEAEAGEAEGQGRRRSFVGAGA